MGWTVRGSNPGRGKRPFSSQNIRPAVEPTQPHTDGVSEVITPGRGGNGCSIMLTIQCVFSSEVKNKSSYTSTALNWPSFHGHHWVITACLVVNCVWSSIPKDSVLPLKCYYFVHSWSKLLASKLTQWNLDYTFLRGPFKMNIKSME
jgi:hypothetical protein